MTTELDAEILHTSEQTYIFMALSDAAIEGREVLRALAVTPHPRGLPQPPGHWAALAECAWTLPTMKPRSAGEIHALLVRALAPVPPSQSPALAWRLDDLLASLPDRAAEGYVLACSPHWSARVFDLLAGRLYLAQVRDYGCQ